MSSTIVRWSWLWLPMAFFILGSSWAITSPVGSAPDDDYHLASIWCAQGDRDAACLDTGLTPPKFIVASGAINSGFCYATKPNVTGDCANAEINSTEMFLTERLNNAQNLYPGGFYAVHSIFVGPNVERSVFIMRIFNILLTSVLLSLLIRVAPAGIRQSTLLTFIAAFTPLGVFLVASTNPSGWAIVGTLFMTAFGLSLMHRKTWRSRRTWLIATGLAISAAMAITSRVDSSAFTVIAVLLIFLLAGAVRIKQQWVGALLLVGIAVIGATTYLITTPLTETVSLGSQEQNPDLFWTNLFNVPDLIQGIVGGWPLGWNDTVLPDVVPVIGLLIVGVLAYVGISSTWPWKSTAIALAAVALVGLPLIFMQLQGIEVGEVVQSRYLLPLFSLLMFALLIPRKAGAQLLINRNAGIAMAISLWFTLNLSWWVNAHRYAMGAGASFFDVDASWSFGLPLLFTAFLVLGSSAIFIAGSFGPSLNARTPVKRGASQRTKWRRIGDSNP